MVNISEYKNYLTFFHPYSLRFGLDVYVKKLEDHKDKIEVYFEVVTKEYEVKTASCFLPSHTWFIYGFNTRELAFLNRFIKTALTDLLEVANDENWDGGWEGGWDE